MEETIRNSRELVDNMYMEVKSRLKGRDKTIVEMKMLQGNAHQIHQQGLWEKRIIVGAVFVAVATIYSC